MYGICEIYIPTYISVSILMAYFTVNSSLSGAMQVLKNTECAADISALKVEQQNKDD